MLSAIMPECCPARGADSAKGAAGILKGHMLHEQWHTWTTIEKISFLKTEILLGITICFAQVPESVAFAFMAHIKPPVALHAAWIVGLICTIELDTRRAPASVTPDLHIGPGVVPGLVDIH